MSARPTTPSRLNERRVFLGVFLLSLCVLMLQLALTRVFSATMYYHFAFLAISATSPGPPPPASW